MRVAGESRWRKQRVIVTLEYFLHGKQTAEEGKSCQLVVMEPLRQQEWGLFQIAVMEA